MKIIRDRRALALTIIALLAVAGAAMAYWTSSGGGAGSATTSQAANVTISQSAPVTGLYPGGPDQSLPFVIHNPADGPQYIDTVTAAVTGTDHDGCDATDFQVTQGTAYAGEVPTGDTDVTGAKAPTISMVDKGSNQDACQGATVTIAFTVS